MISHDRYIAIYENLRKKTEPEKKIASRGISKCAENKTSASFGQTLGYRTPLRPRLAEKTSRLTFESV